MKVNFNYKDELAQSTLKKIGELIKTQIPKGYGFSFILMDYGDTGGIFYISSVERSGFIESLEELLPKLKGEDTDFRNGVNGFKNGAPAYARTPFSGVQLFLDTWGFLPNDNTKLDSLNREKLTELCQLALEAACQIDISGRNIKILQKFLGHLGLSPNK